MPNYFSPYIPDHIANQQPAGTVDPNRPDTWGPVYPPTPAPAPAPAPGGLLAPPVAANPSPNHFSPYIPDDIAANQPPGTVDPNRPDTWGPVYPNLPPPGAGGGGTGGGIGGAIGDALTGRQAVIQAMLKAQLQNQKASYPIG